MKIKGETYVKMLEAVRRFLEAHGGELRDNLVEVAEATSPLRARWDLWHMASFDLFNQDTHPAYATHGRERLSPFWGYYNATMGEYTDAHIDTALRRIAREVLPEIGA